jgi:hypothetical protein
MKRRVRRQLGFAAAVLVLLAAAWWQLRSDRASAPDTLLAIDPNAITRVDLKIGNVSEHYLKRDGHWWRTDQSKLARADDLRLGELTRIAAAPVRNWQPADSYDPAKIGLSPGQASLDLDGHALIFGGMTAIGQGCYVQAGQQVAIVSLRYMPRSAQSATIEAQ